MFQRTASDYYVCLCTSSTDTSVEVSVTQAISWITPATLISSKNDCTCFLWKFSNLDPCAKESRDNLRTLFMHFISINVLLAQDQKDGRNLNFLMKVISSSFLLILRVIRLCAIREWAWDFGLYRDMAVPQWAGGKLQMRPASQSRNLLR